MLNFLAIVMRRLILAVFALLGTLPALAEEGNAYTFAVIPSAPPVTMHKLWKPFVDRLGKETGIEFRLKHYEKMAEFERDIWNGGPDFMFSSPIQLTVAHMSNGYVPLVRNSKLVAIGLFVRNDSPIRSIDDLTGKKISFVGNKNICSVSMQHLLSTYKERLSFEKEYAGSTRNVIINVLLGKSDAGAIFLPEMDREPDDTRNQLREVVESPKIAPHPISAHPRVPATVREAVKKATLAIAATADGAALLATVRLGTPVAANYEADYRALEVMDIKGLTNWGQ